MVRASKALLNNRRQAAKLLFDPSKTHIDINVTARC